MIKKYKKRVNRTIMCGQIEEHGQEEYVDQSISTQKKSYIGTQSVMTHVLDFHILS
jgi:hypothetical protein